MEGTKIFFRVALALLKVITAIAFVSEYERAALHLLTAVVSSCMSCLVSVATVVAGVWTLQSCVLLWSPLTLHISVVPMGITAGMGKLLSLVHADTCH